MNLKYFLLILLHEVCATAEQIFFKKGINHFDKHSLRGFREYVRFNLRILRQPIIWLAFVMVGCAWLVWFVVLAGLDLSVAVPVDSMQYIMVLLASYLLLKERINLLRVLGTLLILLGVLLVVLS